MSEQGPRTEIGLLRLADWFDREFPHDDNPEIQGDLRRWATEIAALEARNDELEAWKERWEPVIGELRLAMEQWERGRSWAEVMYDVRRAYLLARRAPEGADDE